MILGSLPCFSGKIKDVDVAKESSTMLKNQILQQSAAAMLSQANSTSQIALNLIP